MTRAADLEQIRTVRQALAHHGPESVRSEGDFATVSLPADDADALRDLLAGFGPRVVVEIGLAYGSSALAIAEALVAGDSNDARLLLIDAFQHHFHDEGWKAIVAAGVDDRCTLLRERSQLALPRLVADGFVADAAFVDGSHLFHNVFVDLAFLSEVVVPGGLVVLDDCEWPSVGTAVRYFELNLDWQPVPIDGAKRLCAYRLPDPRVERSFKDFRPFGQVLLPE